MGTKINPGKFDCYANALPDEPMFTLLARDEVAADMVYLWAERRQAEINTGKRPATDMPMVREAREVAFAMMKWRRENMGRWRKANPDD